ncbi:MULTISPECIES: polysaccharide deacetylase family protein [unclassified Methanoculleus]|jgi:peptidoglycan/xylan/chitin deacetylase (PgdA/CDA1 family)|uniref:polysaccharide deacetylase family protein n=3 Tax=Methanoculleus TaxID=45989 RepID=UPI00319D8C8F
MNLNRRHKQFYNTVMQMYDILQRDPEIWHLFTCAEEYDETFRDGYDRFPHYMSGYREPFEPRASQYLAEQGYRPEYPDGQPFAVCLTHDIDTVYRSTLSKGYATLSSMKNGDFAKALANARQIRSKKLPLCNFREIMALEEQYGARSSFYFLSLAPGDQDYAYDVRELEGEIGRIADAGWEVGLHGGHRAYCDPEALTTEKQRLEAVLGRPVVGYRNHYLRFRVPETWEHLSRAGFRYDTTFGYADCAGFRNGMCHPFKPYDRRAGREIDILEIPLAIMDGTLDRYMRLDAGKAWEVARRLIDATERCHGVITILWHNTYMEGERVKLYEKVLGYCREKGAWMTSGEEIANRLIQ